MQKQTILILFGGASNEYEVSLRSACSVIEQLDRSRFDAVLVGITKQGAWLAANCTAEDVKNDRWQQNALPAVLSPDRGTHGVLIFHPDRIETVKIDVIFPVLHGQNCEDGAIQGLFKLAAIPFVGCGVTASAMCFDKEFTHIIAEANGVPMARWILAKKGMPTAEIDQKISDTIGYPCFVKPANSGSSVGTSPVNSPDDLEKALENCFLHDTKAIIEELVTAQEVECAVIGNDDAKAPTTSEIVSVGGFYDYDSKYKNSTATLMIPANIAPEVQQKVRELALKVFKIFECRGLSRVDFFVKNKTEVLFNEINTLPGFTSISMYPKMMCSSGFDYQSLVTRLIELATEE